MNKNRKLAKNLMVANLVLIIITSILALTVCFIGMFFANLSAWMISIGTVTLPKWQAIALYTSVGAVCAISICIASVLLHYYKKIQDDTKEHNKLYICSIVLGGIFGIIAAVICIKSYKHNSTIKV
jgi:Kef-type K+ transport system membrane component KefB